MPEGEWAPERWWTDGEDAEQAEEVPREVLVFTREDVQSLLVDSGSLEIQPDQAWVLVGTDTVVMTDAAEHVLGTRVLDLDIDVRVTPVLFTWDFGDGSAPLTGTDPGAPWPNHTVSHVYSDPGTVRISLRTEWDADFRVEGTSTWIPVAGRAVTETQSEPIEVVTARPRLTTG
ncbi:PKD domain-containing protein [Georgenia satyanarayanai]|uniref:PKD domain-containing protein n=1 Tax=Georgenia satyanarayanai TaxID=860221 RepID=UPI0015E881B3|nr:PKD domain-containing protein [Georgenia satyanarayanai]